MKYLKLFENFDQSEIDKICKKYKIKNYTINPDGSIDVDGDVDLYYLKLTKLPLKFNKVFGDFDCSNNELTSLDGCPKEVGGDFDCGNNKLTSLDGGPKEAGNYFTAPNPITPIVDLFDNDYKIYLDYQETYNFLRKDFKIVKHLLEEAIKDFNEYYDRQVELPKEIEGYTYI
jgi:hypothetical protein